MMSRHSVQIVMITGKNDILLHLCHRFSFARFTVFAIGKLFDVQIGCAGVPMCSKRINAAYEVSGKGISQHTLAHFTKNFLLLQRIVFISASVIRTERVFNCNLAAASGHGIHHDLIILRRLFNGIFHGCLIAFDNDPCRLPVRNNTQNHD